LRPKEQYLALQTARERQTTEAFRERYHIRAGIEGTLSQGIAVSGMRRTRYIGQAKTHLQNGGLANGDSADQDAEEPVYYLMQSNGRQSGVRDSPTNSMPLRGTLGDENSTEH
jgi:hypothetical protein